LFRAPLRRSGKGVKMLSVKYRPLRNQIDLANAKQIRGLTKRLKISEVDLRRIAEKAGNSIAAITKEVGIERLSAVSSEDNSSNL
jgi:hypothetical protein